MNQKKKSNILRVLGLTLTLLAFSNLASGIWKSYQDEYAFIVWTSQTQNGAMIQRIEGNEMISLDGDYRIQLPPQTHVPIENVREWLIISASLLGLGLSCLVLREFLDDKPNDTNQSAQVNPCNPPENPRMT